MVHFAGIAWLAVFHGLPPSCMQDRALEMHPQADQSLALWAKQLLARKTTGSLAQPFEKFLYIFMRLKNLWHIRTQGLTPP